MLVLVIGAVDCFGETGTEYKLFILDFVFDILLSGIKQCDLGNFPLYRIGLSGVDEHKRLLVEDKSFCSILEDGKLFIGAIITR